MTAGGFQRHHRTVFSNEDGNENKQKKELCSRESAGKKLKGAVLVFRAFCERLRAGLVR
jgi:hypothetical protein